MARGKRRRSGRGGLGELEIPGLVKWALALGVGWWVLNKWVGGLVSNVVTTAGAEQPPPTAG